MILEAAGYDVVNATSGAQALGIFSTVLVDLVVLDYAMPGVNGGEVAKVFKTRRPELPILIVSGRQVEQEILYCVDGFLVKGESAELLLQKIEHLLSATSTTQSPVAVNGKADGVRPLELWEELVEVASPGQDPDTMTKIISEINRLVKLQDRKLKDAAAKLANSEINRLAEVKRSGLNDGSNDANSQ